MLCFVYLKIVDRLQCSVQAKINMYKIIKIDLNLITQRIQNKKHKNNLNVLLTILYNFVLFWA